jgi:hypothetical protein
MGSLPRAKAGVGSAVNDTTRQTGGAMGVAVLGSLLASRYRSSIVHLIGHKSPFLAASRDNVAAAKGFAIKALHTQPALRDTLIHDAYASFLAGFHLAALFSAATLFLTALGVLAFLPARARDEQPAPMPAPREPALAAAAAG